MPIYRFIFIVLAWGLILELPGSTLDALVIPMSLTDRSSIRGCCGSVLAVVLSLSAWLLCTAEQTLYLQILKIS